MRGADPVSNVVRFILLLFLQVFLFRQISLGFGGKELLFIFITPLFIALLPLRTPRPLVVIFAFLIGFGTDLFYETLGLHAAASTFTGYIRQFVLTVLAPKDGYKVKANPDGNDLPQSWWLRYLGFMLGGYCLFYFSMEAFSPVFWKDISLKTLFTTPVSWLVCVILVSFLRPRV